jgi:two-component system chemotaxis response regulator CheY
MIIDADPYVRKLAGHFLSEAGYQVEYALDGQEALVKAKINPPDVILLELIIPKLNGLSLCRLLKNDPKTKSIRVVVLSVLNSDKGAQIAGADLFLSKPLEKTRLLQAVSKVLSQ